MDPQELFWTGVAVQWLAPMIYVANIRMPITQVRVIDYERVWEDTGFLPRSRLIA